MQTSQSKEYHNILSPVKSLPPHVEQAIHQPYSRRDGQESVSRLAQGELDILESIRPVLGWRSVTSLATKYYPLFPERQCWKRALAICLRYRARWYTQTLSIRYLLKAVIQQVQETLQRNFSGKLSDIQNSTSTTIKDTIDTILNSNPRHQSNEEFLEWNRKKYLAGRLAHMIRH